MIPRSDDVRWILERKWPNEFNQPWISQRRYTMSSNVVAKVIAVGVIGLAAYEGYALWTGDVDTVTELIESLPEAAEAVIVFGFVGWLLAHFGWLRRAEQALVRLVGRLRRRT